MKHADLLLKNKIRGLCFRILNDKDKQAEQELHDLLNAKKGKDRQKAARFLEEFLKPSSWKPKTKIFGALPPTTIFSKPYRK